MRQSDDDVDGDGDDDHHDDDADAAETNIVYGFALFAKIRCSFCEKNYSHPKAVRRHERAAHFGVFTYRCHICGKGFQNKDNMTGHLSEHTGGKFYKCGVCGVEFRWRASLDCHVKKRHNNIAQNL
ncbi:hypothetical protein LSH36_184g01013 [Paralvinella palmiformis]|uniref:C2H2-type domain-containing protein n=1 Tax=Paralvinella palmiformis TaxID=53620 RepID=A0AAD9JRV7_9ANNE|nr:hypothetical protein LSH36_184g01013 [Paralvinella palmiformis]